MSMPTARESRIRALLQAELHPTLIDLRDESHLHAGHNPDAARGETHYRLTVTSSRFAALTRVQQHRLVMDLLKDEFINGLHALSLVTKAE